MANVMFMPQVLKDAPHVFGVFSDWTEDQADTQFVDTVTDSGTVLMGDAVGGQVVLTPSDCTVGDNDEAYLACPNEIFKVAAGKPLYGECRMKFSEVAGGVLNFAFAFQNAVGANSIIDTAGGLKVSGDTLGIYKAETTALKCVSVVNGGTATVSTSTFIPTAGTFYTFGIEVVELNSTQGSVVFTVDGVRLKDSNLLDIVHTITYASSTEMQVFIGLKLGAITNNDTLTSDYLGAFQQR